MNQAAWLGKKLVSLMKGEAVGEYTGDQETMIVLPIGRTKGVSAVPFQLGNCLTQMIKGDLFVKATWVNNLHHKQVMQEQTHVSYEQTAKDKWNDIFELPDDK